MWILGVATMHAGETDTRQGIFHPSFRTLMVVADGNPAAPTVMALDDERSHITVSFDELADERRHMRYELIHCDAAWVPEGLVASEFLDGFNEGTVEDYEFSRATLVHYVHYTITIPNPQIRITQPGNYVLRVYDEADPDETILQARFGVCDFSASVAASVSSRTDIDTNEAHQQLEFAIDLTHSPLVEDPYSELRVVVEQNGREDNRVSLSVPTRVAGRNAIYEHRRELIFPAGNEYRRFENISTTYPGMGVESIDFASPVYNMTLYTDRPRSSGGYLYDQTQHGRFLVREGSLAPGDPFNDTEADYVMTRFTLDMPELSGADIFLDGDFTSRHFDPLSRMVYNRATGSYEQFILLKQGAYSYQYLVVPEGKTKGSTAPVEGDYYQTANEYTVRVYHRPRGTRFDRLIGVTRIVSGI